MTQRLSAQLRLPALAMTLLAAVAADRPGEKYYAAMAVHAGHLYTQIDRGTYIAVNLEASRVAWRYSDPRLGLFTEPVFAGRRLVLAATRGSRSEVLSLMEGKVDWRASFGALGGSPSPMFCNETILVGDHFNGNVRALDISTGQTRWERGGPKAFFAHPPAVRDGTAYYLIAHSGSTQPWAITGVSCAIGDVVQSIQIGPVGPCNYPIILHGDRAILFAWHPHTGTDITAVDLGRNVIFWRAHIDGVAVAHHRPIIYGDKLILTEDSLCVLRLDTGEIVRKDKLRFSGAAPALAGNTIVLQTGRRTLSAVDLSSYGTAWETKLSGDVLSNIVTNDGSVYIRIERAGLLQLRARDGMVLRVISLE